MEDEKNNIKIESMKIMLGIAIDEYKRECERERIIENKANIFLGFFITFVAIIIQLIPFKNIADKLINSCICYRYIVFVTCIIFIVAIAVAVVLLKEILNI